MVKRTLIVLGILALSMMAAGTSMAQIFGGPAAGTWISGYPADASSECLPLYVPVEVNEPPSRTIVKTWSAKIEGPCPPPGMPRCGGHDSGGSLFAALPFLVGSFPICCDLLFGGFDGVYGVTGVPGMGLGSGVYGPVPGGIAGLASVLSPPVPMFGCYW